MQQVAIIHQAGRYALSVDRPRLPGFGHTEAPTDFAYSIDRLADVPEGFVTKLGLSRFVMYVFDFGGPVGFRLATRHPEWIAGQPTAEPVRGPGRVVRRVHSNGGTVDWVRCAVPGAALPFPL